MESDNREIDLSVRRDSKFKPLLKNKPVEICRAQVATSEVH